MRTFKVTHLCTCVCVEYPTIYINVEAIQHILIVLHIYVFEKNTHSHAQGIASKFTLNYVLNICYHKLPTHTRNIYTIQTFIVSLTLMHIGKIFTLCTYLHSKGNPVLSYVHLGRDLNIPSPFAKNFMPFTFTYVYTLLQGVFHATSMQSIKHGAAQIRAKTLTSKS